MSDPHKPFKLGNLVKSPVYGMEGIATVIYHHAKDRVPQVLVNPYSNDPLKVAEGAYIDENLVDYVGEGFVDRMIPPVHNPFNFDDKIRDKISGLEGIVTGWTVMMNGCIDIRLTPNKLDKDGKYLESCLFPVSRVELVEPKKVEEAPKKSLVERAMDLVSPETYTTNPATRPARKTGSAMHRGENLNRK